MRDEDITEQIILTSDDSLIGQDICCVTTVAYPKPCYYMLLWLAIDRFQRIFFRIASISLYTNKI